MSFDGNGQIRAWHSAKCLVGTMGSDGMGHTIDGEGNLIPNHLG